MDFFPHLGYEISEAQLVIPFITNISVIFYKMHVFIKHLHKTNEINILETSNQYTYRN